MQAINASYEVLRDPSKRRDHDIWIQHRLSEVDRKRNQETTQANSYRQAASATTPKAQTSGPQTQPPTGPQTSSGKGGCGCLIIIIIGVIITIFSNTKNGSTSTYTHENRPSLLPPAPTHLSPPVLPAAASTSTFSQPKQPLPNNGQTSVKANCDLVAPFEIKSKEGGGYFVKLADFKTNEDVLSVFVRGGQNIQIKVPLGKYIIKYASGDEWYGYDYLFGPSTTYSKANDPFEFTREISPAAASRGGIFYSVKLLKLCRAG